MSIAPDAERGTGRKRSRSGRIRTLGSSRTGTARSAIRKQGVRTAVTMTAAGLALAVPFGGVAAADLDQAVLERLSLDAATTKKVKAYDEYRMRLEKQEDQARKAVEFAKDQIGKPYAWGAEGPNSYDCSGLMMAAWRKAGVKIPRVTYAQYRKIDRKVKMKNLKPGDLVFFRNRGHVGMYVGNDRYVHAPSSGKDVRINKITKRREKQFAGAVRPGAPEKKEWSSEIKNLVEKIDRLAAKATEAPPDKTRAPDAPHTEQKTPPNPSKPPIGSPAGDAQQAEPPARPGKPKHEAPAKNTPSENQPGKKAEKPEKAEKAAEGSQWLAKAGEWMSWPTFTYQAPPMTAPGHRRH